ncbi:MAG: hypothetical protein KDE27_27155, partial [Planctomycetes bacterium]|nr:hypothetical protein [Planctomycetota bacterium]
RVREFVDDGNLPPAARADAVIALAKSSTPEVAAIGKQAAKELVRQLAKESSESGAGAVGAPGGEGAADSTPGEARSEPSPSGRDGDEGQDDDDERVAAVLRVAAALDELHLPGEAVDLLVGFAALRRPTAKTLRAIAATLEGWAARIDAMERDDPKRPRQVEGYFAAVRRVYGEVHTRGAAVAGIATLSNSADEELAARANEERSVMAKRSVARAEVLKREQKSAAAARELDHAAACEPSRIDAAAEAAQLYEGVGALADAARLYKWILARDGGDFARRSRERLIALWQAAKARAGDIRTAVNTLPQDDEGRARGTLALVEMGMPVLEGPELEFVRDQISDGGFAQATARLNDLIGGVASQVEPAWPARVSLDAAPRVGRDFELRDLSVAGRWVDGADGEPGMWCTLAPVDRELTRLVGKYGFPTFDEPSGYTAVSWFNAQVFCGELTIRERDAERLPPGCEYRLPTIAELDRIRAVTGRVTDRDVAWLWTCETGWPDFNARGRRRPFAWPTAPGREAEEQDSSRPIPKIGFVVVLAPAR